MNSLIEHLYSKETCANIRALWSEPDLHVRMTESIARRVMQKSGTVLPVTPSAMIDLIMILCMANTFAYDEMECSTVATIIVQGMRLQRILPMVSMDRGMTLARKTLISLAFFRPAMEERTKRRGAPSLSYYRGLSQVEFRRADYCGLADNHAKWEAYLSEIFV